MKMQTLVISYIHNLQSINISRFIKRNTPICHLQSHCDCSSVLMTMWNVIKPLKVAENSCGHTQTMGSLCLHSQVLRFLLEIPGMPFEGNYVHWTEIDLIPSTNCMENHSLEYFEIDLLFWKTHLFNWARE